MVFQTGRNLKAADAEKLLQPPAAGDGQGLQDLAICHQQDLVIQVADRADVIGDDFDFVANLQCVMQFALYKIRCSS